MYGADFEPADSARCSAAAAAIARVRIQLLGNEMDPRPLLINLETPYAEYSATAPIKDVLLAGLRWETQYWASLAVSWIEQGAPIDKEIQEALDNIAEKKHFPQSLRHKAFALARRWQPA